MDRKPLRVTTIVAILLLSCAVSLAAAEPAAPHKKLAAKILQAADFKGGLIVHVGAADGALTTALRAGDNCIVQGLDTDPQNIQQAGTEIASKDLTGKVTIRLFDGANLPYIDNLVNLVVITGKCNVSKKEILRVLAPRGVAYINGKVTVKPWPDTLDEWTHFHHDPQGTMVGTDKVVAPPRRIQWMGEPKWLRNHDFMTVMHAMVSSHGRIFYVTDEALRNHIFLPSRWMLIARDAFNGTILWKKPLSDWHPANWPLKSGPGHYPRKLVAVGDTVYVAAGLADPVTAIDAATGKTIRTYEGTKPTQEIIIEDGILYALVDPDAPPIDFTAEATSYKEIGRANSQWAWTPENPQRIIKAIKAETGKILWQHPAKVSPLSLTICEGKVLYHNGVGLVALDKKNAQELWATDGPKVSKVVTGSSLRLSYSDGVAVFASGTNMTAFRAKDGKQLWTGKLQKTSHHCPEDLFIIDGLIWSPNTGRPQEKGTHLKVLDLHTGEIKKDFVASNLPAFPMHPRCYPSRATTSYLMMNGMGTEFYKIGDDKVDVNNWVRGSCIYGVMPANGLLYKPPDTCACYYQSKLEHLCALAPGEVKLDPSKVKNRLHKGPAYNHKPKNTNHRSSWLTYRGDSQRSGYTASPVPTSLDKAWTVKIGGKLTQPVAAHGKAYIAAIDRQTLYALDADSGKTEWTFTATGRIDSSPTLYKDLILFGSADGCVYCLRANDGALVWRYLVAPEDTQNVSYQQLESLWPVHGSVLVQNDTVYALAGRNMFLDGGMRLVLLDPATGDKISETVLDENDPATGKNLQTLIQAKYMPVANADLLSSDGDRVYMQEQNFDMLGKRLRVAPTIPNTKSGTGAAGDDNKRHLFCQTGFLDGSWFHRSYLIYGADCGEGWGAYAGSRNSNPSGRIMVLDDKRAYAYRANPLGNMLHPRTNYYLYAVDKDPSEPPTQPNRRGRGNQPQKDEIRIGGHKVHWQQKDLPLLVNAMALADKNLFIAGPLDVADETKMLGYLPGADDQINRQLDAQDAAWRGRTGGLLWAVSADTGRKIAQYKIESVPVSDGMAVAQGKVLISMIDGSVVCFDNKKIAKK